MVKSGIYISTLISLGIGGYFAMINPFTIVQGIIIYSLCLFLVPLIYIYGKREDEAKKAKEHAEIKKQTRDEQLKSEMRAILDQASETLDYEIGLLRCANPLSDKLRDILLSIEKFGSSTKYPFKDTDLEKLKIDLINLCSEIRARFTGYNKNLSQDALDRGEKELALMFANKDLENVKIINEFERVLREFVKRLNA